jgi:hypothetical protein
VAIRERHGLVPVVEAGDAHDRPEGLGVRQLIIGANAADDRRVSEEASLGILADETRLGFRAVIRPTPCEPWTA